MREEGRLWVTTARVGNFLDRTIVNDAKQTKQNDEQYPDEIMEV